MVFKRRCVNPFSDGVFEEFSLMDEPGGFGDSCGDLCRGLLWLSDVCACGVVVVCRLWLMCSVSPFVGGCAW